MIRPGETWLTLADAAVTVGRSQRTLSRWAAQGRIVVLLGRVDAHALMLAERDARAARNTPRGIVAAQTRMTYCD